MFWLSSPIQTSAVSFSSAVLAFFIINSYYHGKPPTSAWFPQQYFWDIPENPSKRNAQQNCIFSSLMFTLTWIMVALVTSEIYWQRVNFGAQLHTLLLVHAGRGALSLNFYRVRTNCDKLQTKNPSKVICHFYLIAHSLRNLHARKNSWLVMTCIVL